MLFFFLKKLRKRRGCGCRMGALDVLCFLIKKRELGEDDKGFTIREICKELQRNGDKGNSYESVRLALLRLEAKGVVKGRCFGRGNNYQRYFKLGLR